MCSGVAAAQRPGALPRRENSRPEPASSARPEQVARRRRFYCQGGERLAGSTATVTRRANAVVVTAQVVHHNRTAHNDGGLTQPARAVLLPGPTQAARKEARAWGSI